MKRLVLLLVAGFILARSEAASAYTSVSPPWGTDSVIALVGIFDAPDNGAPRVLYKNVQIGSAYYGATASQILPNTGSPDYRLNDDVTIYGGGGDDVITGSLGGEFTSGTSTLVVHKLNYNASSTFWLNGHWLDLDGAGGNDYLYSWFGDPSYIWGQAGNDRLLGTNESAYIMAGNDADSLRGWNPLYLGQGRYLFGEAGNDCLESNNSSSTQISLLQCGADTDSVALFGNTAGQSQNQCEASTASHCVCLPAPYDCIAGSDCCSGSCLSDGSAIKACASSMPRAALFVVGNVTLSSADTAIKNRLIGFGFNVTVKLDSSSASSDANFKDLVVISDTSASANVGTKFTASVVPVLVLDAGLQDEFNMTGSVWSTDQGTTSGTQVSVVASGQIANGFSGNTTVVSTSSTLNWGVPGGSPTVVSRVPGSATQATGYTYAKGATMKTGTAPGKRAMFFDASTTAASHNGSGWGLFDALINWLAP